MTTSPLDHELAQHTTEFAQALSTLRYNLSDKPLLEKEALPLLLASYSPELEAITKATDGITRRGLQLPAAVLKAQAPLLRELLREAMATVPFVTRCVEKPLGYAGDYATINCVLGDPLQGPDLYSRLVNFFVLQFDIAQGHRNRIEVLHQLLLKKAHEAHLGGRPLRVLSIGCGPAEETFRFLNDCPTPEVADITLLDFSREALGWAGARLEQAQASRPTKARIRLVEESVFNLARKPLDTVVPEFDLVICAGLFDYLTDRFCQRVLHFGVRALHPAGMMLVTNVSPCDDRVLSQIVLDWDLLYRTTAELNALLPRSPELAHHVYVDSTGTNVIAEVRKLE